MKKLILFESILILFFVLAWNISKSKPGETYHCKKVIGEFMKVSYGSKAITRQDWGSADFHFKWNIDKSLKFSDEWPHFRDMKVHSYVPEQGELFQANVNEGQTYMHYIDGLFTYSHTADGRLWIMIADCESINF